MYTDNFGNLGCMFSFDQQCHAATLQGFSSYRFYCTVMCHFFPQELQLSVMLSLVGELEPFFWMMWPALELKDDFWTVLLLHLAFITVSTVKMLVLDAHLVGREYSI